MPGSRKSKCKASPKASPKPKVKRAQSAGQKAWLAHVNKTFASLKKENKDATFKEALIAASKTWCKGK